MERGFSERNLLLAVEPSDGMIETFRKNFQQQKQQKEGSGGGGTSASSRRPLPRPPPPPMVIKASSYYLPVEDGSIDAVLIAQGFHWFADQQAVKEIARVLVSPSPTKSGSGIGNGSHNGGSHSSSSISGGGGGKLGLIWNYDDLRGLPPTNWQVKVTEYIWTFDSGVPQYRHQRWRNALSESQPYFKHPYGEDHFLFEVEIGRDEVWPYWRSRSFITALSDTKQQEVRLVIEGIVMRDDIPKEDLGKDGVKLVARRGTHIVWTERA